VSGRLSASLRAHPVLGLTAACGTLAAWTLRFPAVVNYDPLNWLMWGREILHGSLDTTGGTVWKPFPMLVTTPLALAGPAAAAGAWLWFTRTAALLALAGAARLGTRLGGVAGGILAAALLAALPDAVTWFWTGTSEWPLAAAVVWGADAGVAGRRRPALLLVTAATLIRPEAYPFLLLAAWWARRQARGSAVLGPLLVAAVPLLWVLPEWVGAGSPLAGDQRVLASPGAAAVREAAQPWRLVLDRFGTLAGTPTLALAAVVVALDALRRRPATLLLGAAAGASVAGLIVMAQAGYPAESRFLVPAAALTFVLAGVAVERLAAGLGPAALPVKAGTVALVGVLALAPAASARLERQVGGLRRGVAIATQLDAVVQRAGGAARVRACGRPQTYAFAVPLVRWTLDLADHPARAAGTVLLRQRVRLRYLPAPAAMPRTRRILRVRWWELREACAPARATKATLRASRGRAPRVGPSGAARAG
jgi:hypothetical protein